MIRCLAAFLAIAGTAAAQPTYYTYVIGGSNATIERNGHADSLMHPFMFGNLDSSGVLLDGNNLVEFHTRTFHNFGMPTENNAYSIDMNSLLLLDGAGLATAHQFFEFDTEGMDLRLLASVLGGSDFDLLLNDKPVSDHPYIRSSLVGTGFEAYELSLLAGTYKFEFSSQLKEAGQLQGRMILDGFAPLSVPEPTTFAILALALPLVAIRERHRQSAE